VALEACKVAVQASWNPRECNTYHDLLDREEQRLDEAFGGMMPDELPGAVVAVAEVWLDDAYDNFTLAQACLTARRQQEQDQGAALEEHPEPPDGEISAEKARRLWILRAFQQASYVRYATIPPKPTGHLGHSANINRSKSETQGQLSRRGGAIRARLGLLFLGSRDRCPSVRYSIARIFLIFTSYSLYVWATSGLK
jgi:hypothetical protein